MDRNGTDKPEASAARPRENVARESASPGGQDGGPDNQAGCDRTRPSALQTVRIPRRAGNRTLVPSRRCTRERCSCENAHAKSEPVHHKDDGAWRQSDAAVFAANRTRLLERLASRNVPISYSQSYLFFRKGRVTTHLGPCVSETSITARSLVEEAVQSSRSGWSWDLLPRNGEAVALARDLGFSPQRHLVRMTRGRDLRANDDRIFATAGFELG